ncbi:MAG: hypothetical protein Q4C72_01915 [Eubacteriales bacterium]|nr:hypothetical protein [Eubacteriales bacterium]
MTVATVYIIQPKAAQILVVAAAAVLAQVSAAMAAWAATVD